MRSLPLYRDGLAPWAEVELATPLDRDVFEDAGSRNEAGDYQGRKCDRCNLSARVGVRTPCMDAVSFGGGGGLLIIGDAPTKNDDIAGVPFTSPTGKNIRRITKRVTITDEIIETQVDTHLENSPDMRSAAIALLKTLRSTLDEEGVKS